jgi:zinc D-Ala-D-Ala carboxypeptidase
MWDNFNRAEFACQCSCGTNEIKDEFIDVLQDIRSAAGVPMPINSGYRCPDHPIEQAKSAPGSHTLGLVADVGASHKNAFLVLKAAMAHPKVTAIGVNQKGAGRYIHIGVDPEDTGRPRPHLWSY